MFPDRLPELGPHLRPELGPVTQRRNPVQTDLRRGGPHGSEYPNRIRDRLLAGGIWPLVQNLEVSRLWVPAL